ncbi:hypothetical protein PLICRDRAFT_170276 [Plicaturopsis crispa FD-325 SS-3]|nr:hypothetical protein PLICRDRAFT_170276 [Plicaturopsis crispa FD-325 SS-3]
MAAVHGPSNSQHHPDPFRTQNHNIPRSRSQFSSTAAPAGGPSPAPAPPPKQAQPRTDPFYGHERIARLCARFITHLFACPENAPVPTTASHSKLPLFIAYALHRTKLKECVTHASLVLLQRLKARFPTARGSSGHRLFISAFMIASKVMCDDTYSNKSWSIVAQNMFALREINQMEREMCNYLEWELNVEPDCLKEFTEMVCVDFAGPGPYPTYALTKASSSNAVKITATLAPEVPSGTSTSPIPSFGQQRQSSHSPPKAHAKDTSLRMGHSSRSYDSPALSPPSPSHSDTTSPATSASPSTPGYSDEDDDMVKIASAHSSPSTISLRDEHSPRPAPALIKTKVFAYAGPTTW